jgi:catechol 2,3-dioxygenase-like lactoylglutathione lyase family enzyme
MTAAYLGRDGFVLELLHFAAEGRTQPYRPRAMNEPGLTHVSVSVDDIDAVADRVADYGGTVVEGTNIGVGLFVRDPDGQLLELLPMAYRESLEGRRAREGGQVRDGQ